MQRCSVVIRRSWQSVQTYFVLFSEARKEDLHDLSPDMSITKLGGSQRFVPSIGNIEKAMWVLNCLGRPGHFWSRARLGIHRVWKIGGSMVSQILLYFQYFDLRFDSLQKLCYIFNILSFEVWLHAKLFKYFDLRFDSLQKLCCIFSILSFEVWFLAKIMLYFQYFELCGLTPCNNLRILI